MTYAALRDMDDAFADLGSVDAEDNVALNSLTLRELVHACG